MRPAPNYRRSLLAAATLLALPATAQAPLAWRTLPPLPDPVGVAGAFAGVSDGALLVAGGANFPGAAPWDGGPKIWHDRVWMLAAPDDTWREVGRLPAPRAYGASFDTPQGVLCAGGSDAGSHSTDCMLLRARGGGLEITPAAPLPFPLANAAGAVVGSTAYVVGGSRAPTATTAAAELLAIDLDRLEAGWRQLEPLPGEGRILPVAAAQGGTLLVLSGAALSAGPDGTPQRRYLTEAWSYTPGRGWRRLADLPRAAVAAPSPGPIVGASHVLVLGGDDGSRAGQPAGPAHPGFRRDVIAYHTITDTWTSLATIPAPLDAAVTAPVARWNDRFVIASGEIRPGVRTPQVATVTIESSRASFAWLDWLVVVVYLGGMVWIGVWFMRRDAAASTDAWFRGGQRVPAWVAGLSIFATMLSALTFMGIPARAYQTDCSWYLGQLPLLVIVPLVVFCYLPFFRRLDVTSAYEYLERRFGLACRLFASLSFMLFHIGRIALVLYLPALALAAVSDIDVTTSILVIGVLCLVYTVLGGIQAVMWADAVQAAVLLLGAGLCVVLAVTRVDGGLGGVVDIALRDDKLLQGVDWTSLDIRDGTASGLVIFVAFGFNSLVSYTSSQDVVQRYVTTRDLPAARRSLWINMWMSLAGSALFFVLGVAIYAFYKMQPAELDPALTATDSILPHFIVAELPTGIAGLVIAAIFAASQSTISSSLNSIATAFVTDIDKRLLRPARDDRAYLRSAQVVAVVVGLAAIGVALWMATARIESAFKTFNTLIGLTAGSLGGLFALGVFTRRANASGALAGALLGLAVVVALELSNAAVTGILYAFVGLSTCVGAGLLLSFVLPGRADASLSLRTRVTRR
ncbi:MAG: sodium/solute symporter [Planctomycetes bacterium]|nr:sodium/solute symporter [Planctomycetota bacterium]